MIDRSNYHGVDLARLGPVSDVAVSAAAACVATTSGDVLCWGDSANWGHPDRSLCASDGGRQVGRHFPEQRLRDVEDVVMLSAGDHHHMALTLFGEVYEWGHNWAMRAILQPTLHAFDEPVRRIASTHRTRCVLFESGQVGCWGLHRGSEDGPGANMQIVEGLENVVELSDGWSANHVCARTRDERVFCWGQNDGGQLGDNTRSDSLTPVEVDLPEPAN